MWKNVGKSMKTMRKLKVKQYESQCEKNMKNSIKDDEKFKM
jgi:hypothetical protein